MNTESLYKDFWVIATLWLLYRGRWGGVALAINNHIGISCAWFQCEFIKSLSPFKDSFKWRKQQCFLFILSGDPGEVM